MSVKRRKCRQCSLYTEGFIKIPAGVFCNIDHAWAFANEKRIRDNERARKKAEKAKKAKHAKQKRDYYDNDLVHQHKLTQKSFNKMRVLEEKKWFKDRNIEPYCISCGKEDMDWCCGHLKTVGAHGRLRYDRNNTFLQCNRYCNMALSGNISGNKNTKGYLLGLHDRFGKGGAIFIEYCRKNSHAKKWVCDELIEMRKGFNEKIRELERGL